MKELQCNGPCRMWAYLHALAGSVKEFDVGSKHKTKWFSVSLHQPPLYMTRWLTQDCFVLDQCIGVYSKKWGGNWKAQNDRYLEVLCIISASSYCVNCCVYSDSENLFETYYCMWFSFSSRSVCGWKILQMLSFNKMCL